MPETIETQPENAEIPQKLEELLQNNKFVQGSSRMLDKDMQQMQMLISIQRNNATIKITGIEDKPEKMHKAAQINVELNTENLELDTRPFRARDFLELLASPDDQYPTPIDLATVKNLLENFEENEYSKKYNKYMKVKQKVEEEFLKNNDWIEGKAFGGKYCRIRHNSLGNIVVEVKEEIPIDDKNNEKLTRITFKQDGSFSETSSMLIPVVTSSGATSISAAAIPYEVEIDLTELLKPDSIEITKKGDPVSAITAWARRVLSEFYQ
ncbi:hypothetical protein KJ632_02000 [Patescibacteria group bacterium]|nr:hypothetical protein [Patescibacteria group bacterium]